MTSRVVDLAVASAALLGLAPVFVLVPLAIRVESRGSPFYGGYRVGKGGRRFRMWKFRTMVRDADQKGGSITRSTDARITRLGAILRQTKVDELPQFFNLLLGDVTLVGPRPEAPDIVDQYSESQREVLDLTPGITGPNQVREHLDVIPEGEDPDAYYVAHLLDPKIERDLQYARTRNWSTDTRLVAATVGVILRGASSALRR